LIGRRSTYLRVGQKVPPRYELRVEGPKGGLIDRKEKYIPESRIESPTKV
jgi:hypothetical protein